MIEKTDCYQIIQIKIITLLLFSLFFASCHGQNKAENTTIATTVPVEPDPNIRSIFQDKKGDYWFGTNSAGVYRFDGKTLIQYTVKDGLANNQVQSIQEDAMGNLWFGTGVFGVSRFDGLSFTTFTTPENLRSSDGSPNDWTITPNDLWFYAGGGVYRYDGRSFVYLPLDTSSNAKPYDLSRFAVYSLLKDTKGNLWFGTQAQGVCRFDGKSFIWFTEKGLHGPAVLGLFEDSSGNLWFGNNGSGLFKYDGKNLTNVTEENGLGNDDFKASGKSNPGSLARVYSINEDRDKNLWVGTVDAGVWRYDGKKWTHYTTKEGLTSNAVNVIYKDHHGALWFGTDSNGVCRFDGEKFVAFVVK